MCFLSAGYLRLAAIGHNQLVFLLEVVRRWGCQAAEQRNLQ